MARRKPVQTHELVGITEDLLLMGGGAWKSHCSCSWSSRHCSDAGVARGLWRRHLVLAGRGVAYRS